MKDDRLYVIHIGECLARIAQYVAGGREAFMHSTLIQDAVLRNLQTIGQSVSHTAGRIAEQALQLARRRAGTWVLACSENPWTLAQRGPVSVGRSPS